MRKLLTLQYWRARRADAAALAGIGLFFVAFFPQGLFGGKYLIVGDAFFYSYPLRTIAWRMLRHGQFPLWTPYIMSGYPLLSMAQIGLAYPLTWGYLFLPGHVAEQIYVLAPFLLAPVFTYAYLRKLARTPLAALMGALTFGYGGMMASPLANNGLMPNAVIWLPLLLIAIERARTRRFVPCLLWATGAYALSVLTGYGQGFLYTGLLGSAYALFLVFTPDDAGRGTLRARLASARQWQPLFVMGGALLLAAGVAAFQILETARVARRSVRSTLSYEIFTQGSFTPTMLWQSFTTPIFYFFDMHAAVPPLALALAVVAAWTHARRRHERDPRVFFYLALAGLALALMLGPHTPLYRLIYHIPLLNRFRVPSRHTFEWTFALAVLAAYGWDATAGVLRKRRETYARSRAFTLYPVLVLLAASVIVGALWWLKVQTLHVGDAAPGALAPTTIYRLWKGAFVSLTLAALWRASLIARARWRFGLVLATVLVLCYVEPSALIARWWGGLGLPASRFAIVTDGTRFLRQLPPEAHRVYTRVDLFNEQYGPTPRFDAANLSAVYGLHNVAGYEPLILERYSRALGGVGLDSVRTFNNVLDSSLLTDRSHVLDLLNTTFVVSYPNLSPRLETAADMTTATGMDVTGEVLPQATRILPTAPIEADALELVTALSNSTSEPDDKTVARVRIHTMDGRTIERELKAGRDTAEWAHERPDVRPLVKHRLAPVFDTAQVGGADGFKAYRYKALFAFDEPVRVRYVEISNVTQTARLGIYGARLRTARTQFLAPLLTSYSEAWQPVYEQHETLILRNTRAQPRAWLVAEAEAVDGEEALRRIRGESAHEFDPTRTALLEVRSAELPPLPGGSIAPDSAAHVTSYEPNRLMIETNAPTATVLVVSEIFYPGWTATVDGQPAQINVADYLLRGVVLPAGQHNVEMRYTALGARTGAVISVLTLCLLAGLAVYARRTRTQRSDLRGGATI